MAWDDTVDTPHAACVAHDSSHPTPNLGNMTKSTAIPYWLFVIFGEHQVMAQLIATRVLISPLINKDFSVRHPLPARGNFASVNLNHQK
jgi:hypothetical protein